MMPSDSVKLTTNYWVAQAYVDGVDVDFEHMAMLEREDTLVYDKAWGS